jgi:outer membrane protein assembly factor BamB
LKSLKIREKWFSIGASFLILFSIVSCSGNSTPIDVRGFSNLVLDNDMLWFGAGYKLYQIDLNQRIATPIYDTKDVVITFVEIAERRLFFGGYHSPTGNGSVIWSFDIDSKNITWSREVTDYWGRGRIFVPPLIDKEMVIFGTKSVLYGIDKAHGDSKWKIKDNWFGTDLTPITANGQLFYEIDNKYFGGDEILSGRVLAIADPHSGATIRTISMPGRLGATPIIHGDCLFVKDYEHYRRDNAGKLQWVGELRLNCVDLSSGKIVWTFQGHGVAAQSKISFHNGLVFDVFANQLFAIDEQSGVLRWQSPRLEYAAQNPQVIVESNIIALEIPRSNKVIFLDLTTGTLRNETLLNALSPPVFVGREAIYGTTNAVVRVDVNTGHVIWSIPVDSRYQVFPDE